MDAVTKTLCSHVANKKPTDDKEGVFRWKRFTGELLFVCSNGLFELLGSEERRKDWPWAWADDKGLSLDVE